MVAQTILSEQDDFSPIAAYVRPDGGEDVEILAFLPEARQRAIAAVTRKARERDCRGLIFVGDSWTAPPVRGREPRVGDALHHPQREECLLFLLFTPDGSWGRTVRYRREGKKIIFEPPDEWFAPNSPWNPWEQEH